MLETVMMIFLVIGFAAGAAIAGTLVLIALGVVDKPPHQAADH